MVAVVVDMGVSNFTKTVEIMTLYKTTIMPKSNFATALRGDTLFGQMCWAVRYLFGEQKLKNLLSSYEKKPFLVVSDAFASGYLPKPKLPSRFLNDTDDKKISRKKIWMSIEDLQSGNFASAKTDLEVGEDSICNIVRNSINYESFTTDGADFSPYASEETAMCGNKDIFCLINEDVFSLEELEKTFAFVADSGYGKDTTIGKGRFEFCKFKKVDFGAGSKCVMALSPFCPQGIKCTSIYYEPFTRFGKTGYERAKDNPFKKPILLADTAGVICFEQNYTEAFIGKAITNISTHKDIVHQGYAILAPIKELA
ncbi:MAG: hypothetical protein PHE67_01220 [Campylobacterales bacterium]|nr:hypothetical protein [Campylobacterales bacterium]